MAESRVFSVALSQPFLENCAEYLTQQHADGTLHDAIIFLPNQRTARMLREQLAARQSSAALLLPHLIPTQRMTREGMLNLFHDHQGAIADFLSIPPAMSADARLALLARQVQASHRMLVQFQHLPKALQIARDLATLHDEIMLHRGDLQALIASASGGIHSYADVLKRLFAIIAEHWPAISAETGSVSEAEHQQQLQACFITHLPQLAERHALYVIGSTGSVMSTRELMQAVTAHPRGQIILPGAHGTPPVAQARLHIDRTLAALNVQPPHVHILGAEQPSAANAAYYALKTSEEEARLITLLTRQSLEEGSAHCLVITPDIALMKRVAAHLACMGITANTPPLSLQLYHPAVQALMAMCHVASQPESKYLQRALLDVCNPREPQMQAAWEDCIALLDAHSYRNPRDTSYKALETASSETRALVDDFNAWVGRLRQLRSGMHSPENWLEQLAQSTKACALLTAPELPEAIAITMVAYGALGTVSIHDMAHLLGELAAKPAAIPADYDQRVSMLTPVEARLYQADHVIFASFHSEYWPRISNQNAWLGNTLRAATGLPIPEDETALAAHDIWLHACSAKRVSCTRALNDSGRITHPSPLMAMLTLTEGNPQHIQWVRQQWMPDHATPEAPAEPNPPISARPRTLRVSDLDALLSDPYSIYARYVLGLEPLDDYDSKAEQRELGTLAHRLIQQIVSGELAPDGYEKWLEKAMSHYALSRGEALFWQRRLYVIAAFAEELRATLIASGVTIQIEESLTATIPLNGGDVTLEGRADLITTTADKVATITDFKSGSAPNAKSIELGKTAQLLGYALLLELRGVMAAQWRYTELPKVNSAPAQVNFALTADAFAERKAAFTTQLAQLLFEETPFLAHPLYEEGVDSGRDAFDGVSRIEEWG